MAKVTQQGNDLIVEVDPEEFLTSHFAMLGASLSGVACVSALIQDRLRGTKYEPMIKSTNVVEGSYQNGSFRIRYTSFDA